MKKIIFATLILIFTNATLSLGGQFRSKWGVVISVTPISVTSNYSEPSTKVFCKREPHVQQSNFADIAVGGLIGSVIGNKLSEAHGAGSIGALFGSMIAADKSYSNNTQSCFEKTVYTNKSIIKLSHYNVKVRTRSGIVNIQSSTPYNLHDVIFLN
jgi:uncharacterized protein YcfJ